MKDKRLHVDSLQTLLWFYASIHLIESAFTLDKLILIVCRTTKKHHKTTKHSGLPQQEDSGPEGGQ